MPITFDDVCRDFVYHIKHERGLSASSVAGYSSWLKHFQKWCEEAGVGSDQLADCFNTPVLRRYLYWLSGRGLRPRSIWSAFFPLRGLGVFLIENGLLTENPTLAIKLPKKDKSTFGL
jgi:site-specific recombinase XerD